MPLIQRAATMADQVYLLLRDRLADDPDPELRLVEREVSLELGVSRTPVREALARLASEGFLIATQRGHQVPVISPESVENMVEMRILLEPQAARQAAEHEGETGLGEMARALRAEQAAHRKDAVSDFLIANMAFRDAWLLRVRNPLLLEALSKSMRTLRLVRRRVLSDPRMRQIASDSHAALLQAIEARNPDEAERQQEDMILRFGELVGSVLFPDNSFRSTKPADPA